MSNPTTLITVFYAGLVYGQYPLREFWSARPELPDGVYVLAPRGMRVAFGEPGWYRKDLTPVLIEDVPGQLRAFALLLS